MKTVTTIKALLPIKLTEPSRHNSKETVKEIKKLNGFLLTQKVS